MGQTTFPVPVSGKNYYKQEFTSSGTWTVPSTSTGEIDIVVVAGGGGGGRPNNGATSRGAGGGAPGQVTYMTNVNLGSSTSLTITIGGGGNGSSTAGSRGSTGSNTTVAGFPGSKTITCTAGDGGSFETNRNESNISITANTGFGQGGAGGSAGSGFAANMYASTFGFDYKMANNAITPFNASNPPSDRNSYSGNAILTSVYPSPRQYYDSTWDFYSGDIKTFPLVPTAYLNMAGGTGTAGTGSAGGIQTNTFFAGQGGNGGMDANNGGSGAGGGGGGGGGTNSTGTTGGNGGNGAANSGGSGGGGGGSSVASTTSGNGGAGGSGFVVIGYWA
jgi:hypothetical protein